jgi:hypothetical protein
MRDRSTRRSFHSFPVALTVLALCWTGCKDASSAPSADSQAQNETLLHLEARSSAAGAPHARASYRVKRVGGELIKEFEVEVTGAQPGVAHAVTLDGHQIGRMVTDLDGEAELELGLDGQHFPAGFDEPQAGSVLQVGEAMELRLEMLEKLVHLESVVPGGQLSGKASFKIERLAGEITREFKVKISGAPADTVHDVSLDGVRIGELSVDSDGKGKLEFSDVEGSPFPAGFPQIGADSSIQVGELFSGKLQDRLAVRSAGTSESRKG